MNSKVIVFLFGLLLINFAVAEELTNSNNVPVSSAGDSFDSEQTGMASAKLQNTIEAVTSLFFLLLSIVIGIFLMVYMIRKSPRMPHLIIHGLIFVGSIIGMILILINVISSLITRGSIVGIDLYLGWPLPLLLIFSGYITINLIYKENFSKKWKYVLGLSSGMIITSLLAFIFMMILSIIFQWDGLGVGIMSYLILMAGTVLSIILGIIGFFIDKYGK